MQIRKLDNNFNPNFQRLYMPARKTLMKYGEDFMKNAEKQRAVLKDYASNLDIYLIPRIKDEDKDLFETIYEISGRSKEQFYLCMPKGSYFNIHVAPKFPREMRNLVTRASFEQNIYSAFGVEAKNLVSSIEDILRDKTVAKSLSEKTKYYNTFS